MCLELSLVTGSTKVNANHQTVALTKIMTILTGFESCSTTRRPTRTACLQARLRC
jgi:hypothetical protein